ncbi:chemotaxis protein CheW [Coriobacteriia bacterium Es71-Z0120]|uniref:chemotaxis protein CheW n=1 Tax=Parvivirga hydrogeniphila TaxID=2939460 RepID=UPI002260B3E4|nr:chemotaxis protein CheW [Parvivirga hydrogeniphila]MCL4078749.1 chemotaxis protein CheW [Parvivirga hydrogeniphila]
MPRKKKTAEDVKPRDEAGAVPDVRATAEGGHGDACEVPWARLGAAVGRVVVFSLDGQRYALPIEDVQEIQQVVEFAPVPDAHPALLGMVDVRGIVTPAVDMGVLLGLGRREIRLETPMILFLSRKRLIAAVVDEVDDVFEVPPMSLQAPSDLYSLKDTMIGVCKIGDELVIVLDPDRLVPSGISHDGEGRP